MGVGLAVAATRLEVTLLVAAYLVITLLAAIRTEETFLASAFGDEYARYRSGRATASARRFAWVRVRANRGITRCSGWRRDRGPRGQGGLVLSWAERV
jgi:hypothetical protein